MNRRWGPLTQNAAQGCKGDGVMSFTLMLDLLPFQRRFIRAAFQPGIRTAALSLPRGNGKSSLAAHVVQRFLTPGDPWFQAGAEIVLCAGSIEQARHCFRPVRAALEPTGAYRFLDSQRSLGVTHPASMTRLRVHSSNAKTAMGLVGVPLVIADEPGAWEVAGGELMHDAIQTAQGKPESPLKALYIGTLAPAMAGWWHELVGTGSAGSTHVTCLQGDPDKWDDWNAIRRANPLMSRFPESRAVLLDERDQARRDSRLKARYLSYRLNLPSADESEVLLTVSDWKRVCARPVAGPFGRPIVGIDLGAGRAWSAAVAIWPSGRVESVAVTPGIPGIAEQEKRDRVPAGTYQRLVGTGRLLVAGGLRIAPPSLLVAAVKSAWGVPTEVVLDRFRLDALKDAAPSWRIKPRVTRWSEASDDIRALRKIALDGPLSCPKESQALITASLSAATVRNDDQGSTRLVKRGSHNTARDDVAAALLLSAGAFVRSQSKPKRGFKYAGMAG